MNFYKEKYFKYKKKYLNLKKGGSLENPEFRCVSLDIADEILCNDNMDPITLEDIDYSHPENYYKYTDTNHCITKENYRRQKELRNQVPQNPVSRRVLPCEDEQQELDEDINEFINTFINYINEDENIFNDNFINDIIIDDTIINDINSTDNIINDIIINDIIINENIFNNSFINNFIINN